jgi:hypothetical protein
MLLKEMLMTLVLLSTLAGTAVSKLLLQFVRSVSQLQFKGHDDTTTNCNSRVAIIT